MFSQQEIELFIQKMMDKIVSFYHGKAINDYGGDGYDTDEDAFYKALDIVKSTAFVSAEANEDTLTLYALDKSLFFPFTASGACELWDYLSAWAKNKFALETFCIEPFDMSAPLGFPIYKFTKNYLLEEKKMVDDEVMSFHEAFLEESYEK